MPVLVESVIEKFGGVEGFAEALHDTYEKSAAGSPQRARLLDSVNRMLQFMQDRGLVDSDETDPEAKTDVELAEFVQETLESKLEQLIDDEGDQK